MKFIHLANLILFLLLPAKILNICKFIDMFSFLGLRSLRSSVSRSFDFSRASTTFMDSSIFITSTVFTMQVNLLPICSRVVGTIWSRPRINDPAFLQALLEPTKPVVAVQGILGNDEVEVLRMTSCAFYTYWNQRCPDSRLLDCCC